MCETQTIWNTGKYIVVTILYWILRLCCCYKKLARLFCWPVDRLWQATHTLAFYYYYYYLTVNLRSYAIIKRDETITGRDWFATAAWLSLRRNKNNNAQTLRINLKYLKNDFTYPETWPCPLVQTIWRHDPAIINCVKRTQWCSGH